MSQQNQQFYEFQWRALNLCSEFYNAAEELVVRNILFVSLPCLLNVRATRTTEGGVSYGHSAMLPNGTRYQDRPPHDDCRRETCL